MTVTFSGTKAWTFLRSELEVVERDPDRRDPALPPGVTTSLQNRLEEKLGKDLDGDGDIGEARLCTRR